MEAKYIEKNDYDKTRSTKEYPNLRYYSAKTYRELYHNSNCQLVGAIGEGLKDKKGSFLYKDTEHAYYELDFNNKVYCINGYVLIGEQVHLALIGKRAKKKSLASMIAICVSLIACLIAGSALFMLNQPSNMDSNAKDYTPNNAGVVKTDPNHIALPGYDDLKIKADSDVLYVSLWNPKGNPCNFEFTISMQNGETLYKSKLVGPGKAITEVKLDRTFKKGVYDIVIKIDAYALDDKDKKMNGGNISTRLIAIEP